MQSDAIPSRKAGRVRQLLCSPWTWASASLFVRLVVLATLPKTAHHLAIGQQTALAPVPHGTIAFLQSRVLVAPLTEDEHEYDEIGRNVATGRGFVLDSQWLITTPGQPVMYAGFMYPAFVGVVYWVVGCDGLRTCQRNGRGRNSRRILHLSSDAHLVLDRHDERINLYPPCRCAYVRAG